MHCCMQFTWGNEHTRQARDTCHDLALNLPYYKCGVSTGTVTIGKEM